MEIQFPITEPTFISERDSLSFRAVLDNKPLECLISAELLMTRYGARGIKETELREAFTKHRQEIEDIARDHILVGWTEKNRVLLTTRFTKLGAGYQKFLEDSSVKIATGFLIEMIGPNAGTVNIDWKIDSDGTCICEISDPTVPTKVSAEFLQQMMDNHEILRFKLARLWGGLLQARSRHLLLKSG